jgi:hypothetical protein
MTAKQLTIVYRNQKLLPPSGSRLHIPSIALLPHDRRSLGIGLCRRSRAYHPHRSRLCSRTLPWNIAVGLDTHVFPRRTGSRQAKARSLRPIRHWHWRGRTRIRVLLRRTSFTPSPRSTIANMNAQVSIRAFLPLWVFLYVLQFLFMPLIARDYWVSNFFGNSMYLLALSYYFVITFLGYNGKRNLCLFIVISLTNHFSPAFPEPDRSPPGTCARSRHHLDHQSVHLRLRDEPRASAVVWSEPEKGSLRVQKKNEPASFMSINR